MHKTDIDRLRYFPMPQEDEWKLELITIMIEEQESCDFDEDASDLMKLLCTE